ncbi:MAG: hypothetical protein SGI91_21810 [Alphaproteobacteria bacterium]|jgi:hypothetical protein|nr:hypothetical protein [Alphaproteobacteria bacterium]
MLRAICTAIVLAFVYCGVARAADEFCDLKVATVLEANTTNDGRLFVPASFAGHSTFLQIHSGSAWSFVESRLVDTLKLPRKPMRTIIYVNAVGDTFKEYVSVPQFKLGALIFGGETDFVIDPTVGDIDISSYGGTLGVAMLSPYDVEIDNAAKRVTLWRPDKFCSGRLVRWADRWSEIPFHMNDDLPILRAKINGETINASINTASSITSMDLDVARSRFGITPQSPGVRQVGDGVYMYTFAKLTISDLTFESVEVRLVDYKDVQLSLGMNVLRQLHLYIAFKRKVIYATRIEAK